MILESIVTTVSEDGQVNIAPMGPIVENMESERPSFLLRPFKGSRTFENLSRSRKACIHVTDDVMIFAQTATGQLSDAECRVRDYHQPGWKILQRCHRWFVVQIVTDQPDGPRHLMQCETLDSGIQDAFFGFNRAKHAVIEAAILATRTHLLPAEQILADLERLESMVQKTSGPNEQQAFELLRQRIHDQLQ